MMQFDYSKLAFYLSVAAILFQVWVLLVNVIVQAIKGALWDKLPTNMTALIVSEVLTVALLFAAASVLAYPVTWYMVVSAVVIGIVVAYAAMFGYDKLLSGLFEKISQASNSLK